MEDAKHGDATTQTTEQQAQRVDNFKAIHIWVARRPSHETRGGLGDGVFKEEGITMTWRALQLPCMVGLSILGWVAFANSAHAKTIDANGEISLGLRAYASARIQAEDTDRTIFKDGPDENAGQFFRSLTFPISKAGQLRQARYFIEIEWKHDIQRLYDEGFGPMALLKLLPFKMSRMRYQIIYRGDGDAIYDIGSKAFTTRDQYHLQGFPQLPNANIPAFSGNSVQANDPVTGRPRLDFFRRRLRENLANRNRLFQAFVDFQVEDLFVRFGRQILVWGETDAFRLLDNINPIDNGFGGFLIPLDERRVPLDMLRVNYYFGDLDKIGLRSLGLSEAYAEAFWALDNAVGWSPGINIKGSPWALPNLGEPSATQWDERASPGRSIKHSRGGIQFKFNAELPGIEEATFGIAHYYTFFDTPQVRTFVAGNGPGATFPNQIPAGVLGNNPDSLAVTLQQAVRTQVTGITSTFAVPAHWARLIGLSGEPIVRTELAYFRNEPRHQQEALDPFTFALAAGCGGKGPQNKNALGSYINTKFNPEFGLCTVDPQPGDSWNFVLGIDTNQFIHALNVRNSFFITTQFFYKHLNGAARREPLFDHLQRLGFEGLNENDFVPHYNVNGEPLDIPVIQSGEVLPVPAFRQRAAATQDASTATQPSLVHNSRDQFLQTLLISTSYASGQIVPTLTMAYDWSGSFVLIPQITFLRDPFRLTMSYSYLEAGSLKGNSGISLLRDRDSFLFQFEYVI